MAIRCSYNKVTRFNLKLFLWGKLEKGQNKKTKENDASVVRSTIIQVQAVSCMCTKRSFIRGQRDQTQTNAPTLSTFLRPLLSLVNLNMYPPSALSPRCSLAAALTPWRPSAVTCPSCPVAAWPSAGWSPAGGWDGSSSTTAMMYSGQR